MKKLITLLTFVLLSLSTWADQYPDVLYVVGNATTAGWLDGTETILYRTSGSDGTSVYEGFVHFTGTEDGEMKFLCQNSWSDMWGAQSAGFTMSGNGKYTIAYYGGGSPDNKFKPSMGSCVKLVKLDCSNSELTISDTPSTYEIGNFAQLKVFADCVNKFKTDQNAKLTDDIEQGTAVYTPIGSSTNRFNGSFDGQNYKVTLGISTTEYSYQGLFGQVKGGATISNLIVDGSVEGVAKVAGIVGYACGGGTVTLTNVINKANVKSNGDTDANAAGLVGCAVDNTIITATNCANLGEIRGQGGQCAAFAGWTQSGTTFTNCWNGGTIYNMEYSKDEPTGNCNLYRNSGGVTATNCYDVSSTDNPKYGDRSINNATSGELCHRLNGDQSNIVWYQAIGKDSHPVFSGNTVYACNNAYTNLTVTDDYCQIDDFAALNKFSLEVNAGNASLNGKLTADIDMSVVGNDYTPIGTDANRYSGTFNGNNHHIKNLKISNANNNQGLFGVITNGCHIQNIILNSSCSISAKQYVGGFVGQIWDDKSGRGDVYLEQLGNEADITGTEKNVGAILGVNMYNNGYVTLHMTNCYNTGHIKGSSENGVLTGWSGENAIISNCYAAGSSENCDKFARLGANCQTTNIYSNEENPNWKGEGSPIIFTDEQIKSGELCYNLGSAFTQDLSAANSHPTFGQAAVSMLTLNADCNDAKEEGVSETDVKVYGTYSSSSAFKVPSTFNVSTIAVSNGELKVSPYTTGETVPANTGVMLSAAKWDSESGKTKDFYFNVSSETGTSHDGNCLKPTGDKGISAEGMAKTGSTFYRLTMHNGEKIGFYWGAADGAAFDYNTPNRAYLALPNGTQVKSGFWFGDSESDGISSVTTSNSTDGKFLENGQIVIVKNGKKFNSAGQAIK